MSTPEEADSPRAARGRPASVVVVGGGTAGYFAALALKRRFPEMSVTVVESKSVPIIGVGEATTTLMPPFLHDQLGIDVADLFTAVEPTLKLGVRFEWGAPDTHFNYAFGHAEPVNAMAFDGSLRRQSLLSMMMDAGRIPVLRGPDGVLLSALGEMKFAYHLDNEPFVRFLAAHGKRLGVLHEEMTIAEVVPAKGEAGVSALRGSDGRQLAFDFYVDASGFRSLLIGGACGSAFKSYAGSLFCDRAVVGDLEGQTDIRPYTTAETMNAGWCWKIPMRGEEHRGYVYSSSFSTDAEAEQEFRSKNPAVAETRVIPFRSGRRHEIWIGNVFAVGNAYGFVEPLQSSALHMVVVEVAHLLAAIATMDDPASAHDARSATNSAVGDHWDYLRWFLAIHYRFNERLDTTFWRAARASVDVSGFEELIAAFQRNGSWSTEDRPEFRHGDSLFGFGAATTMLLGQGVRRRIEPRAGLTAETWAKHVGAQARVLRWALPQREALAELSGRPDLLRACTSPRSWIRTGEERIRLDHAGVAGPGATQPSPRRHAVLGTPRG